MPHRIRLLCSAAALVLGTVTLAGCSSSDPVEKLKVSEADKVKAAIDAPAGNLEDSVRQAQLLRLSGKYPDAIRHLSQLMIVAPDDPRVVSEYGKTLAAMGQAQEAVNFLNRAQQLQPGDWSVYSALGVAYDQMGDQGHARAAYEHALTLKPGEPSVLSNYALSRMLAKDPQGARALAARAEIAGGASDPKIARDIAMINEMAPQDPYAVTKAAPEPPHAVARAMPAHLMPAPAPLTPIARAPLPAPRPAVAANSAPQMLAPPSNGGIIQASPQFMAAQNQPRAVGGVVMQAVPVDPLAGPVAPRIASHAPRALTMKAEPKVEKTAQAKPASSADAQAQALQAKAEALAKQLTNKPAAIAVAKAEANKPIPAPRVLPPTPVKAADAKPKPATAAKAEAKPVKAAAKDPIPSLRMSANAY